MDKMEKTLRNALAVVGAVAVVKAFPVATTCIGIGAIISNPEKVKKAKQKIANKCEEYIKNLESEFDAFDEENLEEILKDFSNIDDITKGCFGKEEVATEAECAKAFDEEKKEEE